MSNMDFIIVLDAMRDAEKGDIQFEWTNHPVGETKLIWINIKKGNDIRSTVENLYMLI